MAGKCWGTSGFVDGIYWDMSRLLKRSLFLLGGGTAVFILAVAIEVYRFSLLDEARPADAAIVLGAAVYRERPSPVFRERINHGIWLYENGYVDWLIFTGGVGWGDNYSEAEVARQYAVAQGVPAEAILVETTSTSTLENLANARQVGAEAGLGTYLIVSTPFHMKRALAIAEDLGLEAYTSPTQTTRWINPYTKSRAYVREVVVYLVYLIMRVG
ncbi:MAG: YdcF family protein [Ardenticatenaceae bacterium]|nr:YdcF family protein [Ardenticatenaceae bacterium]